MIADLPPVECVFVVEEQGIKEDVFEFFFFKESFDEAFVLWN